jgi:hypothetical protein
LCGRTDAAEVRERHSLRDGAGGNVHLSNIRIAGRIDWRWHAGQPFIRTLVHGV